MGLGIDISEEVSDFLSQSRIFPALKTLVVMRSLITKKYWRGSLDAFEAIETTYFGVDTHGFVEMLKM